jgi:transposase
MSACDAANQKGMTATPSSSPMTRRRDRHLGLLPPREASCDGDPRGHRRLRASGGCSSLAAAGLAVAVVNSRQVRDFAKATGRVGSPKQIGSMPRSWRALPRPYGQLPSLFPMKRSVLFAGDTGPQQAAAGHAHRREQPRLPSATKPVAKRIAAHVRWLEKELSRTDRDLDAAIKSSPALLRERSALEERARGVGPVF